MKVLNITERHAAKLGLLVLAPFFSAGGWAIWQESQVGIGGGYSATDLQPSAVVFKGTTRYVSQHEAKLYSLSHQLFYGALFFLFAISIIAVLINRSRARRRSQT